MGPRSFAGLCLAVAHLLVATAPSPSLAADPTRAFERGHAAFERGDYEEAERAFQEVLRVRPDDASAHLFLGLTEHELGRNDEAVSHYERAAALDASYRQLALYHAGVAHHDSGDAAAARSSLGAAIEVDPGSETADLARALLGTNRTAEGRRKRWQLSGRTGMEVDDNVTVPELDVSSGEADVAGVFEFGGSFRVVETKEVEVGVGYDFYQSVYATLTQANLQSHTLSLDASREVREVDVDLDYSFTASSLGGEDFLNLHSVLPSIGYALRSEWYAVLGYNYRDKDFASVGERDAGQHALVLDNYFFLGDGGMRLALNYRLESEDATGPEFDYLANVVGARFQTPISPFEFELDLELGYRFATRDYANATPSIGRRRDDQRHRLDFGLSKRLTDLLVARFDYQHLSSISNLPEADYDNNVVNLSLSISS